MNEIKPAADSADPASLADLQRWMQAVICHPYGISAGLKSEDAQRHLPVSPQELPGVILRSRALTSVERLEIYGNAYYARLLECLREMFSALVYALGDDTFNTFAVGYLQQYPSTSYSLNHLADHFVDFLKETRPVSDPDASSEDNQWPLFMIELADLEWTIDQVFDGPGHEEGDRLTPDDLSSIAPEQWHQTRLTPSPSLRLLSFQYPVSGYFTDFRAGAEPDLPTPAPTFLAMNRRDYVVRRFDLSHDHFHLLQSLAEGDCVGDAIENAATQSDDLDQLAIDLGAWFQVWGRQEFFIGLTSDDSR